MKKFYTIAIAAAFAMPPLCAFASSEKSADKNAEYAECVRVMQKFPDAPLIESLKSSADFFIVVIKYNADWGAFPNYVYVKKTNKPVKIGKANVVYLDGLKAVKICGIIAKNVSFDNAVQFISGGKTSIPAIFDVIVIYKSGNIKRIILNQVSNLNTHKYITETASDGALILLRELALITDTPSMFESIYGFAPMPNTACFQKQKEEN